MPPLSLYFLIWLQNLSQTREQAVVCANPALDACNEPIGSKGMMIWRRCCPIHGERAKPLDRAAVAAHVDCCVLCVCVSGCVWLCFVCGSNFSYHTGRKSTLVKAEWLIFAHSYHKIGHQTPQIWLNVQTCHHLEMLHKFWLFACKAVLAVLWVHKKKC